MRSARAVSVALAVVVLSSPAVITAQPDFRFQNNFWVNLHHVLRGEARRRAVKGPLGVKVEQLSDSERAPWTAALDVYADFGQRNPTFDDTLVRINNALTLVAGESALDARSGIDANTIRALRTAAPVYRAHYWAAQRQLNDRWIASLAPVLAEHGAAMAAALANIYRIAWPREAIVVDTCAEAGANGAYTTEGPPGTAAHTTIEAANPQYQDEMAFEMLFHEASHARAIGGPLADALFAEARRQQVLVPRDLHHVIIFYTAGELARRELGKVGDAHYKPFAYRYQVYSGGWERLRNAVVSTWQPYLDGKTTFDASITALIRETTR
jgi:hypothetical protein